MMTEDQGKTKSSQRKVPLVALALPSLGLGGAEVVNASLATQLMARGLRVDVIVGWDAPGERAVPAPTGARVFVLGVEKLRETLFPLVRYLRRERPAAIIASLWPLTAICALAHQFARSRATLAIWEHNMLSVQYAKFGSLQKAVLRLCLAYECRRADLRVAVSQGVADDLSDLSGVARKDFRVVHNPVMERPDVGDDNAAEAVWSGWRGPRILTVGRFKAQKNHPLLLKAFQKLVEKRDARLLMLGDGDLYQQTRETARAAGLTDKIIMPGAVPDPMPYYRSADLFVLSSDYEGFGNVIVEALACGLPVVSTNCRSGPSEILEEGRFGRLTPVGDADALASAMLTSLDESHDREALKRRAEDFWPDRIADQFCRLLFPGHVQVGS